MPSKRRYFQEKERKIYENMSFCENLSVRLSGEFPVKRRIMGINK